MLIQALLSRPVVRWRNHEQTVDRQLRHLPCTLDSGGRTAGADAGNHLHPFTDVGAGALRELPQLRIAQGSGLTGSAADHDPARATGCMKVEETLPRTKIDGTIRP